MTASAASWCVNGPQPLSRKCASAVAIKRTPISSARRRIPAKGTAPPVSSQRSLVVAHDGKQRLEQLDTALLAHPVDVESIGAQRQQSVIHMRERAGLLMRADGVAVAVDQPLYGVLRTEGGGLLAPARQLAAAFVIVLRRAEV